MFSDFKDLLRYFHERDVRYLIVGGYAVSFHAQPRATKDLDLFIQADASNGQRIYQALSTFGAPLEDITAEIFADPHKFIRIGSPPVAVDLLPAIDGVSFEEAWSRRVEAVIDSETGLTAYFISKEDLIASKLAAGRMRDLADVEELRGTDESPLGR